MPFDLPFWRQWEGQLANDVFPLDRCHSGDDRGAVFDTQFKGEPATIKLFLEALSTEEFQVRWEKAAGLEHPALAPILGHGETTLGDLLCAYVITPRADESLADALAEMPLTPAQALDSLQPVMSALLYLESKGLAPAELRPANILAFGDQIRISSDKLVDFAAGSAELLRAMGLLLEEMLQDRSKSPPLPEPFAEVVRNCKHPDPEDPWNLARIEARLYPAAAAEEPPSPIAAPTTSSRKPLLWWSAALAAGFLFGMAAHFWPDTATKQVSAAPSPPPPAQAEGIKRTVPQEVPKEAPHAVAPKSSSKAKRAAEIPASTDTEPTEKTPKVTTRTVNGITQVLPEIPKELRKKISGLVRLNVLVRADSAGRVTQATPQPPPVNKYYTARATAAAQAWRFPPPENNTTQDWVLRFEFTRENTRVSVGRLSP